MTTTVTVTRKREGAAVTGRRDGSLKGLVLSGGKGSRLRPFTYTNAKQLVPIANKPVIFYTIEQLVEAGITDIGIVVGDTGEQVAAAIGDGSQFHARITFIQQNAPLGIAHAVATARDFLGDSPFVLYLGDNFVMGGIQSYVENFRANGSCSQILLHPVPNPEAFGIAEMSGGCVTRIVEKPRKPQSNLAVVGIYMFTEAVHDVIDGLSPSWRGELEITDAIQGLLDRGLTVDAEVMDRYWIDTGKMDDMLNANRVVLSAMEPRCDGSIDEKSRIHPPVLIERGATVEDSVLRGPLVIGRDAAIVNSYIGPNTSIDARCRIVGCRIEDSIIMEDSRLEHLHWPVAKSMIGRFVELQGGHNAGGLYSLTLGDHSRIEMPDG
ncbi:MAG: glucose-1-phosphate thymidylyltransferase [Chloroflexi bacterium]|nr:MAG: glucose-1-phosphate thymidylyltransferase [Chloroflexota bacterium]